MLQITWFLHCQLRTVFRTTISCSLIPLNSHSPPHWTSLGYPSIRILTGNFTHQFLLNYLPWSWALWGVSNSFFSQTVILCKGHARPCMEYVSLGCSGCWRGPGTHHFYTGWSQRYSSHHVFLTWLSSKSNPYLSSSHASTAQYFLLASLFCLP